MPASGIYKIQSNIKPERIYIGSSIDIKKRWQQHRADLIREKHSSTTLQRHYSKYGFDDLVFSIIEPCLPMGLLAREQEYLNKLDTYFNMSKTAGSVLGIKHSIEACQRQSRNKKGKPFSEEAKQNMRGRIPWNKGLAWNKETKDKMSIAKLGKPSPFKGKKGRYSEETLNKLRKLKPPSQLGRKRSEEYFEKRTKIIELKRVKKTA
jgi:group I intron endonuclease